MKLENIKHLSLQMNYMLSISHLPIKRLILLIAFNFLLAFHKGLKHVFQRLVCCRFHQLKVLQNL